MFPNMLKPSGFVLIFPFAFWKIIVILSKEKTLFYHIKCFSLLEIFFYSVFLTQSRIFRLVFSVYLFIPTIMRTT